MASCRHNQAIKFAKRVKLEPWNDPISVSTSTIEFPGVSQKERNVLLNDIWKEVKAMKREGFEPAFILVSDWFYKKLLASEGRAVNELFNCTVIPIPSDDLYIFIVPKEQNIFDHFLRRC